MKLNVKCRTNLQSFLFLSELRKGYSNSLKVMFFKMKSYQKRSVSIN